jgi:CheY-like chemotaxis protein
MKQSDARILVIEDNPADVRLLRYVLDEIGEEYELDVLEDGEEALRFIQRWSCTGEEEPCVILLDLHLPRYDGVAVLGAIRREPTLAHVHVAVLTTSASPDEEVAVLALGVRLYCRKPHELDEFKSLAEEILRICKEEPLRLAAG